MQLSACHTSGREQEQCFNLDEIIQQDHRTVLPNLTSDLIDLT